MRSEFSALRREISKAVVGADSLTEKLSVALLTGGHVLIVGVPGLAKTLLVRAFAKALGLTFNRIQFTPDLMPSDITGSEIFQGNSFVFVRGPVFANVVLADEINRAPPKTQAALLEVMQEKKVTYAGKTYDVPDPFFVLATQNPIEQEGTYPLPEAQLDRFLMEMDVSYPSYEDEVKIAMLSGFNALKEISQAMDREDILRLQREAATLPVPDHVVSYAVRLVRNTRPQEEKAPKIVKEFVKYGAGPRASQFLVWAARSLAYLRDKAVPTSDEVKELFWDVLKHRIILHFRAEAEGIGVEDVLREVLKATPIK
ncbi:MAG: MoxR family ATPase [Thermotogae bacterium]|nr:MoxR family ATPase [Thermotogota bacterium]